MKTFQVWVDVPTIVIYEDEIWPDGEIPEEATAEDAAEAIRKSGKYYVSGNVDKYKIVKDWQFVTDPEITIVGPKGDIAVV